MTRGGPLSPSIPSGSESLRFWLQRRATRRPRWKIGDRMQVFKLAERFSISSEDVRGILKSEGWNLEPTASGHLMQWRPPG